MPRTRRGKDRKQKRQTFLNSNEFTLEAEAYFHEIPCDQRSKNQ